MKLKNRSLALIVLLACLLFCLSLVVTAYPLPNCDREALKSYPNRDFDEDGHSNAEELKDVPGFGDLPGGEYDPCDPCKPDSSSVACRRQKQTTDLETIFTEIDCPPAPCGVPLAYVNRDDDAIVCVYDMVNCTANGRLYWYDSIEEARREFEVVTSLMGNLLYEGEILEDTEDRKISRFVGRSFFTGEHTEGYLGLIRHENYVIWVDVGSYERTTAPVECVFNALVKDLTALADSKGLPPLSLQPPPKGPSGGQAAAAGAAASAAAAVWAILNGLSNAGGSPISRGGGGTGGGTSTPPLIDPDTGEPLAVQDGTYDGGKTGQVWYDGQWVDRYTAAEWIAERREELAQRRCEREKFWADTERRSDEWLKEKGEAGRSSQLEMAQKRAEEEARAAAQKQAQERLRDTMITRLGKDETLKDKVDQLVADKNYDEIEILYRSKLHEQITAGEQETKSEQRWATAYGVGEKLSQAAVTASKGAMMAVGGPAGMAATGLGVGVISAAEEGAESYMIGDEAGRVVANTCLGFLSGMKDGALSVYTNLPGTKTAAKILLPAASDFSETYVRTGDVRKSLFSGGASVLSDVAGMNIDALESGAAREIASASLSGYVAGTMSYANGGSFGEGFQSGIVNHVGGKAGGILGGKAARYADPEERVKATLRNMKRGRLKEIPLEQQPKIIQQLDGTRHNEVVLDDSGRITKKQDGTEVTKEYVNERMSLDELRDTRASRTAKQAPKPTRDAIINTRRDKLYAPADAETIRKTRPKLEAEGILKPGDKLLVMDTFSTPGEPPSLGADRDARLVIERTDPVTQRKMQVEVNRKYWENDAYKDFYEHTTKIAKSGGREITPETHPEYFDRLKELQYLKRPDAPQEVEALRAKGYTDEQIVKFQQQGLSEEQIKHMAWAEAHNQLFTDRTHMEASADNADQAVNIFRHKRSGIQVEPTQKTSSVLQAQNGKGMLSDPDGYARMWHEKPRFYAELNPPEAIAQSQKGIAQYMKIRDGYRAQNIEPPPLDNRTARAMEIIAKAPVGADATRGAMEQVKSQLQELGYKDTNDAMGHIASQNELLKWSKSGEATVPIRDLKATDLARLSRPDMEPAQEIGGEGVD